MSRCLRLVRLSKRPGIRVSCAVGAVSVSRWYVSICPRSSSTSHHATVLFSSLQSPWVHPEWWRRIRRSDSRGGAACIFRSNVPVTEKNRIWLRLPIMRREHVCFAFPNGAVLCHAMSIHNDDSNKMYCTPRRWIM